MIEIYVVLALGTFGYLLNSMSQNVKPPRKEINKFEIPSMTNIYQSTASKKADETERKLAERAYKEALQPRKTNRIMTMAGEVVDEDAFTHNNMEPYFGGAVRQNMDVDRNRVLLENFTGVQDIPKNKCEVKSFYDQNKDIGLVHGMDNNDAFYRDRVVQSRLRNNELPVEQVRVGPGLNLGYTSKGAGGFQQFDDGEVARAGEKCVDQLRAKNKPKETFAGRTLDGLKNSMRGDLGKVNKNRPERFYEQSEDQWFKTTGANTKPSQVPKFNVKATNRLDTNKEIMGGAFGVTKKRRIDEGVKPSDRQQLDTGGIRNAVLSFFGMGDKDDHGKGNIVVYQNERDNTTTRTYQGGLTSLVKAIVAPLEDVMRSSKKEEFTDNVRPYGSLNAQMPDKPTLHPDDPMRTTIRQTTENSADNANLRGAPKIQIYHDDSAKTTIAETITQSLEGMGTIKGPTEIYVYSADEIAKRTIRETLDEVQYEANVSTVRKAGTLGLDDPVRNTMKETTIDTKYDAGINAKERTGTYDDNYEAKVIAKQFLSDIPYTGDAKHDRAGGYETNDFIAPVTQKEFISDNDYYGAGESAFYKKEMDQENYVNATITERKEVLLFDRTPTAQGAKQANCHVAMRNPTKQECDYKSVRELNNLNKVYQTVPQASDRTITKNRLSLDLNMGNDRLDPDLLHALRSNPYAQRLDSVA